MFTIRHSSDIKLQMSSYIWKFDLFPENSFQVSIRIIEDKMVVRAMGSVLTSCRPPMSPASPPEITCPILHKVQEVPKTSTPLNNDAIWKNPYSSRKQINIQDFSNQKPKFES